MVRLVLGFLFVFCVALLVRRVLSILLGSDRSRSQERVRAYSKPAKIDEYYAILGCRKTDSDEDIRRRYRKLAKDYHPDTIQGKGLAEDFVKFANQRIRDIHEAYERIMEYRRTDRR
jgi:DnaJ-domain-containing protein 1